MNEITSENFFQKVRESRGSTQYFAMYSTWMDGVITDPSLMLIPIDDHIVHRGDGIFEAFKFVEGALFDLEAHLQRLKKSADWIGLELPMSLAEIKSKVISVVQATPRKDMVLRLYVSRGPGGFDANPYNSVGSQLYIVATAYNPVAEPKYQNGVKVGLSHVPMKEGLFAQVKSCNYLPNVLMKKEAVDRKLDFVVNLSKEGFVGEGPTENILIYTKQKELIAPSFDYTLAGTTLKCVLELAKNMTEISNIKFSHLKPTEIETAQEVMMVGTTQLVLPVIEFDGKNVGQGEVGPVAQELKKLLEEDMRHSESRRTLVE